MATVNFYMRKSKSLGSSEGAIFLKYFDTGEQFTATLGYEVELTQWDSKAGRLKEKSERDVNINLELDSIRIRIGKIRQSLISYDKNGKLIRPSGARIKVKYLSNHHPKITKKAKNVTLTDLLGQFMDDPDKEQPLSKRTSATYVTAIKHLESFSAHPKYKHIDLVLTDINSKTFVNIKKFFTEDKQTGGLQLNNSTVNKYIACIKAALRYFQRDYGLGLKYLNNVSRMESIEDIYFCTYGELEKLKRIHFPDEKMEIAVKLYIFACYAPARYSDLVKMRERHLIKSIDDEKNSIHLLDFISGKTGVHTLIPLNDYCLKLIKEMDAPKGKLLPVPPRDISDTLHKALKYSGLFDDEVTKRIYRGLGGKPAEIVKRRWELLNFHTSRHTFGSNMIALGESIYNVKIAMGHKKMDTTMRYVHLIKSQYYSSILKHQEGVEIQPQLTIVKGA